MASFNSSFVTNIELLVITGLLAAAPALILLLYFYRQDRRKREPGRMILFSLVLGIASTIPALILGSLADPVFSTFSPLVYIFLTAYVTSALIEESSKLFVVFRFIVPKKDFDEVSDGIVYTIGASMGFAILENILYSAGNPLSLMLLRGITAVPLHAIASGIMGYYIGRSKFEHPSIRFKGLFFAVLIHGTYNFLLFTSSIFSILIIPLLIYCWKHLKKLGTLALLEDRFFGRS